MTTSRLRAFEENRKPTVVTMTTIPRELFKGTSTTTFIVLYYANTILPTVIFGVYTDSYAVYKPKFGDHVFSSYL